MEAVQEKPEHHLAKLARLKREEKKAIKEQEERENAPEEVKVSLSEVQRMINEALKNQKPIVSNEQPAQIIYKKEYNIDDDIEEIKDWEIKDRQYRLTKGRRPISESIRRAHSREFALQYFNKKTGKTHTLRWSPNQPSFFIENQSINASDILDEEIIFTFGDLFVPANNPNLQKFLHILPTKGIVYDEYNASEESEKNVKDKKIKAKAFAMIESNGKTTNRAICSLISPSYIESFTDNQVEELIYNYVETNFKEFIDYSQDPDIKVKGTVKSALANGDITFSNYRFYDTNKQIIIEVDRNKNEIDELVLHFQSNEGRVLYEYLYNLQSKR